MSMRAYRIVEWQRPPELTTAPIPSPGPGEVLVEVAGNGLCHSDVGMSQAPGELMELLGWRVPFTLGHEVGGRVVELGAGATGVSVGDAVAVVSPHSCGACGWCDRGLENLCDDSIVGRGYGIDGGLARYVLVSSTRELVPLRGLDPVIAGPLTDAGATSIHAVKRVAPRLGGESTAVVLGAGGLGSFAIQFLRSMTDARVVAVDISPERRAYALEMGADVALDGVGDSTVAELLDLTSGGAEAVLDFVGTDATIGAGLRSTRRAGSYGLIGAAQGRATAPLYDALPKDGEAFTFQASTIADVHDAIELAESGRVRVDVDLFPLDRVAEAYELMERGELRGRAVVVPD